MYEIIDSRAASSKSVAQYFWVGLFGGRYSIASHYAILFTRILGYPRISQTHKILPLLSNFQLDDGLGAALPGRPAAGQK